ncbi:hypothetical protein MJO28_009630 [Puccinia striiformis f. sp. tritici]|uniref:Uncharacterized protein n=1 Tax=Puccinia striiformis f. sp. tritici TaxID=168172 RepID=A0ACC0E933_9BASI|nr:hypothetical protein MJO28_009630 [Puccinia striiformis f. sp. tritici]
MCALHFRACTSNCPNRDATAAQRRNMGPGLNPNPAPGKRLNQITPIGSGRPGGDRQPVLPAIDANSVQRKTAQQDEELTSQHSFRHRVSLETTCGLNNSEFYPTC